MAQALCLFLAQKEDVCQIGNAKALFQHLGLGGVGLQVALQLEGVVEMVFHNGLAAAGDDENFFDAGGHGLFHNILDGGLIHDGQHLFGHGLGGGQHARAKPGGGDDGFADFVHVCYLPYFMLKLAPAHSTGARAAVRRQKTVCYRLVPPCAP